jgi:putative addiction module component (TIGR02574 family)
MIATSLAEIARMSVAERIQLVEDIWDTIAADPDRLGLSEAQAQELDRRLSALRQNPDAGTPWRDVQRRLRGQE